MALWTKEWKDAKKYFEETTGKKKPNDTVLKVFKKYSGLEKSIDNAEKAYNKAITDTDRKKTDNFVSEMKTFISKKKDYVKFLATCITKEITEKNEKTLYSKSLKYLEKKLNTIEEVMTTQEKWLEAKVEGLDTLGAMAKALFKSIQSSCAKAVAAAAKVKTNPTKAVFDKEIYSPARDVSQYLGNIGVLRKKGQEIPDKYDGRLAQKLYDDIRPYGDERIKNKLDEDANKKEVLGELKTFVHLIKEAKLYTTK